MAIIHYDVTFSGNTPKLIMDHIMSNVQDFAAGAPQADDQTLIIISPDAA